MPEISYFDVVSIKMGAHMTYAFVFLYSLQCKNYIHPVCFLLTIHTGAKFTLEHEVVFFSASPKRCIVFLVAVATQTIDSFPTRT